MLFMRGSEPVSTAAGEGDQNGTAALTQWTGSSAGSLGRFEVQRSGMDG